ncbi:hypothetical protein [Pyxidicoccus xibeiensis]|uniref:hypothetical protein n=1 Tax=Pyxidicoccus xibeiensis TaxID=2906759 RepID=UPI0020A7EDB2|nr:hypothetical protein [Pyxidicoccus xibeiensis]MCP3137015.1 hypothetical protein [Pyxidicoccus xibeiensis]
MTWGIATTATAAEPPVEGGSGSSQAGVAVVAGTPDAGQTSAREVELSTKVEDGYIAADFQGAKNGVSSAGAPDASTGDELFESGRVQVTPAMMPPSLTKLSFDKVKCSGETAEEPKDLGAHFDIVWEPLERAPLARDAFLTKGCWQVSLHAVPIPHATAAFVDTSWSRFKLVQQLGQQSRAVLCAYRQVAASENSDTPWPGVNSGKPATGAGSSPDALCPSSSGWTGIPIVIRRLQAATPHDLLSRFGNKGEEYTPLPSANRAFGVDPTTLVDDAMQAVADVAVEEAEARILQATNELLTERLCGEDSASWLTTKLVGEKEAQPPAKRTFDLFGNTCEAIKNVRLRDLTAASKNLQQALLKDGLALALFTAQERHLQCAKKDSTRCFSSYLPKTTETQMLATAFTSLGALLGTVVLERKGASLGDAQLVVRQAVGAIEQLGKTLPVGDAAYHQKLDLVIAGTTLAFCHSNGRCDTHFIRNILESPEKFFNLPVEHFPREKDLDRLVDFRRRQAALVNIVTEGLEVMSPKTQADASEATRHATSFLRYTTDYWLEHGCESTEKSNCDTERQKMKQLFDLVDAVSDRDVPVAIAASSAVLGGVLAVAGNTGEDADRKLRIQRVMRYASAMASYAGTYSSADGAMDPSRNREEQRLARKQALRSLVDLGSDRSMRRHEVLFSLSVTPGLRPSFMLVPGRERFAFQPSLPLGIAMTYQGSGPWAFYSQVFGADVGQYAVVVDTPGNGSSTAKATPYNALTFGGALGASYKDFVIGVDGRWTPSLEAGGGDGAPTLRPAASLGFHIGYHLPLITFN